VKVTEIGEFHLIELITELIQKTNCPESVSDPYVMIGIGDDAAVWKCRGALQLISTDCLIQDIHFDTSYSSWEDLGYKAISINLSDIAAMGGIPSYILVSLCFPAQTDSEEILSLYRGMIAQCNKYKVTILGGNISAAEKISITATVLGYTNNSKVLIRGGAKAGDKVAITGYTGLSAAGRIMLQEKLGFDLTTSEILRTAHLRPEPKITEADFLSKAGASAAIDVSDGLLSDLQHICKASNVNAILRQDLVPIHPLLIKYFSANYMQLALTGGEDYEILFTASSKIMSKIMKNTSFPITIIGELSPGSGQINIVNNRSTNINYQQYGWEHFK
jgi:thiamine-monophosphate kinase